MDLSLFDTKRVAYMERPKSDGLAIHSVLWENVVGGFVKKTWIESENRQWALSLVRTEEW